MSSEKGRPGARCMLNRWRRRPLFATYLFNDTNFSDNKSKVRYDGPHKSQHFRLTFLRWCDWVGWFPDWSTSFYQRLTYLQGLKFGFGDATNVTSSVNGGSNRENITQDLYGHYVKKIKKLNKKERSSNDKQFQSLQLLHKHFNSYLFKAHPLPPRR